MRYIDGMEMPQTFPPSIIYFSSINHVGVEWSLALFVGNFKFLSFRVSTTLIAAAQETFR